MKVPRERWARAGDLGNPWVHGRRPTPRSEHLEREFSLRKFGGHLHCIYDSPQTGIWMKHRLFPRIWEPLEALLDLAGHTWFCRGKGVIRGVLLSTSMILSRTLRCTHLTLGIEPPPVPSAARSSGPFWHTWSS